MLKANIYSPIDIVLLEHNFDYSLIIQEFIKENKLENKLHIVRDGIEALDFIKNEKGFTNPSKPCLLMLDLNLPYCLEVLEEFKKDKKLNRTHMIIFTPLEENIVFEKYNVPHNNYIVKPLELKKCLEFIKTTERYWHPFQIVKESRNMTNRSFLM